MHNFGPQNKFDTRKKVLADFKDAEHYKNTFKYCTDKKMPYVLSYGLQLSFY